MTILQQTYIGYPGEGSDTISFVRREVYCGGEGCGRRQTMQEQLMISKASYLRYLRYHINVSLNLPVLKTPPG